MTELKEKLIEALAELRKEKERKFDQTLDLIINLQKFDPRKNSINLVIPLPSKLKIKKSVRFLKQLTKILLQSQKTSSKNILIKLS